MQSLTELGFDLQAVLNESPAVIYVTAMGDDVRLVFVSDSVRAILGFEANRFTQTPGFLSSLVHPDDASSIVDSIRTAMDYGVAVRDRRLRNASGEYRWYRDTFRVKRGSDGAILYGIGTISDVTDEKSVQRALEERTAEYRVLAEHSVDLISRITLDGRFIYQSPSARRVMGFEGDARIGESALTQIHVDDHKLIEAAWRTVLKTRQPQMVLYRAFHAEGRWVSLEAAVNPVVDQVTGRVTEFVILSRDISARAEEEKRLAEAQARLREQAEVYDLLGRHSSDFFMRLARDGTMTHVSPSHERVLGRRSLVREGRLLEAVHPDDVEAMRAVWRRVIEHGDPASIRARVKHAAGHWTWIETRMTPVGEGEGAPVVEVLAVSRDISAEISAGRALAEAQGRIAEQSELYDLFANRGAYIFMRYLPDGRVLHISPNHEALLGAGTLVRNGRVAHLVHPDDAQEAEAIVRRISKTRKGETYRHRYQHENGSWVWLEVTLTPIVGRDGQIAEFIAISRDVGDQMRRERDLSAALEALHKSQVHLRLVTDHISDVVTLFRPDGSTAYQSPSAVNVVGYTPEELANTSLLELTHPEDRKLLEEELAANRQGVIAPVMHCRMRHKGGHWVLLERRALPVYEHDFGEGVAILSVIRDVTAQAQHDQQLAAANWALEESRAKLQMIMDNSVDVIAVFGPDRQMEYLSASCELQSGFTVEEFRTGRATLAHPEDAHIVDAAVVREDAGGDVETLRYRGIRKDEKIIWVERRGRKVHDTAGKLRHIVTVTRDVSEQVRHEQEIEAANRQLEGAKLEAEAASIAKSQFLATMSHELRTPMTGIMGMLDLMRGSTLSAEQERQATLASESAESLLVILNDILDLSKIEAGQMKIERETFDLEVEIGKVVSLLTPVASTRGDTLQTIIADHIPKRIWGDAARLRQVLFNLVGNAVKFTDEGLIAVTVSLAGPGLMRFDVSDSGAGIPAEVQARLFRPFVQGDGTSSRKAGGTGLGLAISRSLVEAMGGKIGFTSVENKGSCFWFELPLEAAAAAPVQDESAPAAPRPRRRFNILVAEDHPVNQQLIAALLKREGHRVTVVPDGARAVSTAQEHEFDLILMDIQMPVLDGISATRAIRALKSPVSGIPIVAITANALRGDMENYLAAGMNGYVSKPLRIDALRDAMESAVPHADAAHRLIG